MGVGTRHRDMNAGSDGGTLSELVPAIMGRLPAIMGEVRELLADDHPDYARFIDSELHEVLTAAEGFIDRLVGLVGHHPAPAHLPAGNGVEQALFEEIGRRHRDQGQDITGLLAAYRIGGTVAWRHVIEATIGLGIDLESVPALAGAVFAAVDQLSTASLRGFLAAQSEETHTRNRLRDELATLLLSDRCDSATVTAAARRAGWTLPDHATVVLVDPDHEVARVLLGRLGDSCLQVRRRDALIAIVPDPSGPGRRSWLASTLAGAGAVVGATVALTQLPASLGLAERATRLHHRQRFEGGPLFVDEHLAALVVHHDEHLLDALRRSCLQPLADVSPSTRARLEETLTSWLLHMGNQKAVAGQLHIHPQTVRYRLGQLRGLFGAALDDPATRAALVLALAWSSAGHGPAAADGRPC